MKAEKSSIREFIKNDEVSLRDLYLLVKSKSRIILIISLVFAILGLIKGLTTRDEYETTSQVLSENTSISPLSGLGGLLGNQLRQSGMVNQNAIAPELYPLVLSSDNFLKTLLHEEFYFEQEGKSIELIDYLTLYDQEDFLTKVIRFPKRTISNIVGGKKKDTGLKSAITSGIVDSVDSLSRKEVLFFSPKERLAISRLKERVSMTKTIQFFDISVRMPDPIVAAQLNQLLIDKFVAYVEKYQTEREKQNYEFILVQKNEAEINYKHKQQVFVSFQDNNRGLISQSSKSRETQLQNDYNIALSLYSQLAQQLDHAKIKLQEAKPILTELQPPVVPDSKSAPNAVRLVIIFSLVGLFLGISIIFIQIFIAYFKNWLYGK